MGDARCLTPLLNMAIMAANLLNSDRAIQVSVEVERAFVRLRTMVLTKNELTKRLDELESKYDDRFKIVINYQVTCIGATREAAVGMRGRCSSSTGCRPSRGVDTLLVPSTRTCQAINESSLEACPQTP